ncbi:prostamide/prostaglandin F synthase [Parasteatoda tepidariorum]|uniref:prostamide/prostaglandin F synthase n=1 Tax=Parasteatoda tepidariorum TaxID=114398 RepID=UPI00077FD993
MFCRLAAKQLSDIKPQLDTKNVRLIGIGVEELGVEDFIKGEFFTGDLFVDIDKKCYKDLEYKRHGVLSLGSALLYKSSRNAMSEAKAANIPNDLKGDYYQVGGTFVVIKGGEEVIFSHKQQELADHADTKEILKCLNIE